MTSPPPPNELASPPKVRALHERLFRWRFALYAVVVAHFILAHYLVIGIVTWDGFGHRVPPVVELVQHGSFGLDKFANWALVGFRPFVELTNAPFLWALGMKGLYFGFALGLFPVCVAAVFLFTREATKDPTAAFYAAATYVLTPMVNSQLFSGYVDWAIPGLLALFLYPLLALGRDEPKRWTAYLKIAAGTFLFTMSRQQAPYLSLFFFTIIAALHFVERKGLRISLKHRRVLGLAVGAFVVGLAPSVIAQSLNYIRHGTPIYPYQFNMLGLKIGSGWDFKFLCALAGLKEYSLSGFFETSVAAWLIPANWPYCFYDSRHFGGGLFFITALLTLPLSLRRANLLTRVMLGAFIFASIGAKDFFLPRYAYSLILSLCVCNGLAVSALLESKALGRARAPLYVAFLATFLLHAARPEWDVFRIRSGDRYPRMNAAGSSLFIKGDLDIPLYPDLGRKFVIAYAPGNNFILPIYGAKLTNTVITSVSKADIGPHCEGLLSYQDRFDALVIDDEDLTKDCPRTCMVEGTRCLAYRLDPAPPAAQPAKEE